MSMPAHEGSCEKVENRLLPALSVRRGTAVPRARSTQVERALRARFHLWIRRRNGSGLVQFNFFTASGYGIYERRGQLMSLEMLVEGIGSSLKVIPLQNPLFLKSSKYLWDHQCIPTS